MAAAVAADTAAADPAAGAVINHSDSFIGNRGLQIRGFLSISILPAPMEMFGRPRIKKPLTGAGCGFCLKYQSSSGFRKFDAFIPDQSF
jgi:hypothetical protein